MAMCDQAYVLPDTILYPSDQTISDVMATALYTEGILLQPQAFLQRFNGVLFSM